MLFPFVACLLHLPITSRSSIPSLQSFPIYMYDLSHLPISLLSLSLPPPSLPPSPPPPSHSHPSHFLSSTVCIPLSTITTKLTSKLRAKMWLSKPSCRGGKWLFATCPACISTAHTFIHQWWSIRRARIASMSPIPFISQLPHFALQVEAAWWYHGGICFYICMYKATSVYTVGWLAEGH